MATCALRVPQFGYINTRRIHSELLTSSQLATFETNVEADIENSIRSSQYMRRFEEIETLRLLTERLLQIRPNWDSYGAEPPKETAVATACNFLSLAGGANVLPKAPLASAEGGVAFRFAAADKRALVEFLNTGEVEVMLYNQAGVLNPRSEELGDDLPIILKAVQAHLMR